MFSEEKEYILPQMPMYETGEIIDFHSVAVKQMDFRLEKIYSGYYT